MKYSFLSGLCLSLFTITVRAAVTPTPCGRDSINGNASCPFNLCCSDSGYCGATEAYCSNCQQGFGGCNVVPSPACDPNENTAASRKIGYYQSYAAQRSCNRVRPQDIRTGDLTHLNFAFAGIDPGSFQVVPISAGDEDLYQEFTALQKTGVQTWIAIGGGAFNNPGPTQRTWSQMCSSEGTRQTFITSVLDFLAKYNFQGVDLDWEYPTTSDRGGQPSDTANLAALVKELRAALGTQYGLSVILPPDIAYLSGFDVKSMEPYVNWFGFMSYDLHGPWDTDNLIKPQTDIREIQADAAPLWFDQVNLTNVNFGLAYYGRGFTTTNQSCMSIGCTFSGPSRAANCSNTTGFMSLEEIEELISSESLTPVLLPDAAVKQLTWDDQWIGYDDNETIALKMETANSLCFGGTMIWSVDFD